MITTLLLALTVAVEIPSEIPFQGEYRGIWTAPLDAAGGEDILLLTWSRTAGRTLAVHSLGADGKYSPRPSTRIPVKSDIVAFSIADVRDDPGAELLLFTRSSCFSYSATKDGYAGNAKRELGWQLICDMPDSDDLPFLSCAYDLDGRGRTELVIPGRSGYGIFANETAGVGYRLIHETRLGEAPAEPHRDAHGFTVSISVSSSSRGRAFERLVMLPPTDPAAGDWSESSIDGSETLLRTSRWVSATLPADFDGDGRLDLCTLSATEDGASLEVHTQGGASNGSAETAAFPALPTAAIAVPTEGSLRLVDFDEDGDLDLLDQRNDRDEAKLLFYRNDDGKLDTEKPNQLLKYSGYRVESRFIDLDGDGAKELVVTCFDLPDAAAISELAFHRRLFVHRRDAKRVFARRAATKDVRSLSADGVEGLRGGNLDGDLDGDGVRDVVDIGDDGEVLARRLSRDLRIDAKPFWSHQPAMMIRDLWVEDLDGDGRGDVLLRHARSLKVLVTR